MGEYIRQSNQYSNPIIQLDSSNRRPYRKGQLALKILPSVFLYRNVSHFCSSDGPDKFCASRCIVKVVRSQPSAQCVTETCAVLCDVSGGFYLLWIKSAIWWYRQIPIREVCSMNVELHCKRLHDMDANTWQDIDVDFCFTMFCTYVNRVT